MSRRFVSDLANGDNVDAVFLVSDKQLRANRQGNMYLQLDLRDRTGAISARLWNVSESLARTFEPGDYLQARGKVQVFQGALQIILNQIVIADPAAVDADEFLPRSNQNAQLLRQRLRELLMSVANPHLKALAECFLIDDDFLSRFSRAPAGIKTHHAYQAGLLEHVVNILNIVSRISDLYPDLDRDLLMLGVFLHDAGKVRELSYDRGFSYTDEGQLLGHLVIGVEMLTAKVAEVKELTGEDFPDDLLLRLKHLIISHHGELEFGSPKLPMTPEAIALYYLDNLDAKINTFLREIREDTNRSSRWTPFSQSMNRKLFKGGDIAPNGDADAS